MIRAIVRANASTITVFTDFLSVPKIMGIGPIMITPPPLTLASVSLSVLPLLPAEDRTAIITTMKPTAIKTKATVNSAETSISAQEYSGFCVLINIAKTGFLNGKLLNKQNTFLVQRK